MSPRKTTPDPWPWPADTPLDRARRVARTYRDLLERQRPELCHRLDEHTRALGQGWIVPRPVTYGQQDQLTTEEVANLCDVKPNTVDTWRHRGLRVLDTPDGPRYLVADVLAYHAELRRRRTRRSTSVGQNG